MTRSMRSLAHDPGIRIGWVIHQCHHALVKQAEEFGDRQGLEVVHMSILHALGLGGALRMGDLAKAAAIRAPDMTRRARQLEERGLVSRTRSTTSQREVL